MSKYADFAVWQRDNGTWSYGIYESTSLGNWEDKDYDDEWDREWNHDLFAISQSGFRSYEDAVNHISPNPGHGGDIYTHAENPEKVARFNRMVLYIKNPSLREADELAKAETKYAQIKEQILEKLKEKNLGYMRIHFTDYLTTAATGLGLYTYGEGNVTTNSEGWRCIEGKPFYHPEKHELVDYVFMVEEARRPSYSYRNYRF